MDKIFSDTHMPCLQTFLAFATIISLANICDVNVESKEEHVKKALTWRVADLVSQKENVMNNENLLSCVFEKGIERQLTLKIFSKFV